MNKTYPGLKEFPTLPTSFNKYFLWAAKYKTLLSALGWGRVGVFQETRYQDKKKGYQPGKEAC